MDIFVTQLKKAMFLKGWRQIDLVRATDNRGRSHILVIAEAEAKYAREGPYLPRGAILTASAGILSAEEGKGREREKTAVRPVE